MCVACEDTFEMSSNRTSCIATAASDTNTTTLVIIGKSCLH